MISLVKKYIASVDEFATATFSVVPYEHYLEGIVEHPCKTL